MTKEEVKQELIKRYKFIYENALFILAPYMCEKENTLYKNTDIKTVICLNSLPREFLLLIESFLLSDIETEESGLYRFIEIHNSDPEYLKRYKKGLELLKRRNMQYEYEILKLNLNCYYLLKLLYNFIEKQSGDTKNRDNKLLDIKMMVKFGLVECIKLLMI